MLGRIDESLLLALQSAGAGGPPSSASALPPPPSTYRSETRSRSLGPDTVFRGSLNGIGSGSIIGSSSSSSKSATAAVAAARCCCRQRGPPRSRRGPRRARCRRRRRSSSSSRSQALGLLGLLGPELTGIRGVLLLLLRSRRRCSSLFESPSPRPKRKKGGNYSEGLETNLHFSSEKKNKTFRTAALHAHHHQHHTPPTPPHKQYLP